MIRLLSTKLLLPQEVEAFAALGFQVESLPLIRVQLSETIEAFPQADFAIFTSGNALEALQRHPAAKALAPRRAFCVGSKTRERLESAGWEVVASFGYAQQLATT